MMTPDLNDDERRRVERMRDVVPFLKHLGIEVESVGRGTATLLLPVREELSRNDGIIHGGADDRAICLVEVVSFLLLEVGLGAEPHNDKAFLFGGFFRHVFSSDGLGFC